MKVALNVGASCARLGYVVRWLADGRTPDRRAHRVDAGAAGGRGRVGSGVVCRVGVVSLAGTMGKANQ